MALDTPTKRRSMFAMGLVALVVHPVPDTTIAAIDQKHFLGLMAAVATSTGLATTALHIFSTATVEPDYIGDSGNNVLVAADVEIKGTVHFGTAEAHGTVTMNDETITGLGRLLFNSATELIISSGEVTATQGHHSIDTEGAAANDDLDTINGGNSGEILLILPKDDNRQVRIRHAVGNIFLKHQTAEQSYNFNSPSGSSGTFYVGGFYDFPTTDANLNQGSLTVTHGSANGSYAAHASIVSNVNGTVDSGTVSIVVSGTSVDDEGNRTGSDTETILADITAAGTNGYHETVKKWLGTITYTLTETSGSPATYSIDFNYGFSKYEDLGNTQFNITRLECVGRAGANDTGFNIRLLYHNSADWTYAATGFVPGPTAADASELANMNIDHTPEKNLVSGDSFAYERLDLNQNIDGNDSEGVVIEITTGANKAVEALDLHIGVHSAPNFSYMSTTKQHLIFMKHGPNWLEL